MKLTREQRDNRDQASADAAIKMVTHEGKIVAIAVDNRHRARKMEKRVRDILNSKRLEFKLERRGGVTDFLFAGGTVRIVPVMK